MVKIYADKKYQKYLKPLINKHYKEKEPIVECVPYGIIANEHVNGYGVFDKNFNFVKSSIQNHKGRKGQFVPKFNHENIPYIDEDVIFLCHCGKNNFGHFIVEYMNRAWCLADKKYQNMKVAIVDEINCGKINDYIYVLLGLVGVKKQNIILLNKTTKFRNVYVPGVAFDISAYYTDAYSKMLDVMLKNTKDTDKYDKIYLSRCAMPMDRHTYGEEHIQSIFEKNGFKIIYPETLPLKEQISLMKNCKVLAGCAGTALHLAFFMKPGGTVIQIKRNKKLVDNADTQHLINMLRGLNSVFIAGACETVKTDHWDTVPQIIGVTEYMKQFLDENGFKYNKKDLEINKSVWAAYEKALGNINNEKKLVISIKKAFIHYSSCLLPTRMMRKKYRHFMQDKLLK